MVALKVLKGAMYLFCKWRGKVSFFPYDQTIDLPLPTLCGRALRAWVGYNTAEQAPVAILINGNRQLAQENTHCHSTFVSSWEMELHGNARFSFGA